MQENNTYDGLKDMMLTRCVHYSYYNYNKINTIFQCICICDKLCSLIKTEQIPTEEFINNFIDYITYGTITNATKKQYIQTKCITANILSIIQLFDHWVKLIPVNNKMLRFIFIHHLDSSLNILKEKNYKIIIDDFKFLIEKNTVTLNKEYIFANIIDFITKEDYSIFCDYCITNGISILLTKLIKADYILTQEQYEKLYKFNNENILVIIDNLNKLDKYQYTKICLEYSCCSTIIKTTTDLLHKKLQPTKQCMTNILLEKRYSTNDMNKVISLLIYHGYVLTKEDIMTASSFQFIITDKSVSNILLNADDIIYFINSKIIPLNYKFKNISQIELEIIHVIFKNSIVEFRKIWKTKKIISKYVMLAACVINKSEIINLLLEEGNTVDFECINMYIKHNISMHKYKSLELLINAHTNQSKTKSSEQKDNDTIVNETESVDDTQDSTTSDELNKNVTIKTVQGKKVIIKNDAPKSMLMFNNDKINVKQTIKPNNKMKKILQIDDTKKISFVKVRKLFIQYVNENKLCENNIVKVDETIADTLSLEKDKYFDINKIDNITNLFFV